MRAVFDFHLDESHFAIYFIYAVRNLRTASEPPADCNGMRQRDTTTRHKTKGEHRNMKSEKRTETKPFASAEGEAIAREAQARQEQRQREELRLRQRSMLNAMLCLAI